MSVMRLPPLAHTLTKEYANNDWLFWYLIAPA